MGSGEIAGIIIAAIGAVGAVVAAYFGGRNSGKLNAIHVLVNANLRRVELALGRALRRIGELESASPETAKRRKRR